MGLESQSGAGEKFGSALAQAVSVGWNSKMSA